MSEELVPPRPRAPLDCRGGDLVSRLLAATPPYLYAAPMGAHSYFFSEMLRSLVQAREAQRNATVTSRRARKRSWVPSTHPPNTVIETEKWNKKPSTARIPEKPLELTTNPKQQIDTIPNNLTKHTTEHILRHTPVTTEDSINKMASSAPQSVLPTDIAHSVASGNDLILPPPPPMWYPPLYPPPYGIDPLHFFIDLRVSGHVYDRNKKEQQQQLGHPYKMPDFGDVANNSDKIGGGRQGSAFSVPLPKNSTRAVNLSNCKKSETEGTKNETVNCNTNYVLQNLPKIYNEITERKESVRTEIITEEESKAEDNGDGDGDPEKKRCKDLRALIGLELVVDYVKNKEDGKEKIDVDNTVEIQD